MPQTEVGQAFLCDAIFRLYSKINSWGNYIFLGLTMETGTLQMSTETQMTLM